MPNPNPFAGLFEESLALRTTFWGKIKVVWGLFFSEEIDDSEKNPDDLERIILDTFASQRMPFLKKLGLTDFYLLGLPKLLTIGPLAAATFVTGAAAGGLFVFAIEECLEALDAAYGHTLLGGLAATPILLGLAVASFAMGIALGAASLGFGVATFLVSTVHLAISSILAGALTLLSAPIVGIVHLVYKSEGEALKAQLPLALQANLDATLANDLSREANNQDPNYPGVTVTIQPASTRFTLNKLQDEAKQTPLSRTELEVMHKLNTGGFAEAHINQNWHLRPVAVNDFVSNKKEREDFIEAVTADLKKANENIDNEHKKTGKHQKAGPTLSVFRTPALCNHIASFINMTDEDIKTAAKSAEIAAAKKDKVAATPESNGLTL